MPAITIIGKMQALKVKRFFSPLYKCTETTMIEQVKIVHYLISVLIIIIICVIVNAVIKVLPH